MMTGVATVIATVAAAVQTFVPGTGEALGRLPGGLLPADQLWRVVTPLFVQTLGWYQVVINLVSLAVIGAITEQVVLRIQWLGAFVAGTVGGQIAAYIWHESGGGDSIGICGLAGCAAIAILPARQQGRVFAPAVAGYVATLTGWSFDGTRGAVIGCIAVGAVLLVELIFPSTFGVSVTLLLPAVLVCAVLLAAEGDLHGVSLLCGLGFGAIFEAVRVTHLRVIAAPR